MDVHEHCTASIKPVKISAFLSMRGYMYLFPSMCGTGIAQWEIPTPIKPTTQSLSAYAWKTLGGDLREVLDLRS
jgi:hypothetical protein